MLGLVIGFFYILLLILILVTLKQQAFMLEANLLLGGISSYDRHQDLRLDIDNMSYEVI